MAESRTQAKADVRRTRLSIFGGNNNKKVGRRTNEGKVFNRRNKPKPIPKATPKPVDTAAETEAERKKREEEERIRRLWEDDDEGDDGDDGGGDDGGGDDGGDGDGDDGAGDS